MSIESTILHTVTSDPTGATKETILKKTRGTAADDQAMAVLGRMVSSKKITYHSNGRYTAASSTAAAPTEGKAAAPAAAAARKASVAESPSAAPTTDAAISTFFGKKTRERILARIAQKPCTAAEITKELQLAEANTAYHLNQLTKSGDVTKLPNPAKPRVPLYTTAGADSAEPQQQVGSDGARGAAALGAAVRQCFDPPGSQEASAEEEATTSAKVSVGTSAAIETLKNVVTEAQAALHHYITSCCDPDVLEALERSRDAAEAALEQLQGKAA